MRFDAGNERNKEWFKEYLNGYKEQITIQEEIAQDILGDNYASVYEFFYAVLEEEKEYKILRSRRCQVLFLLFFPIILLNEGEESVIRGTFISDYAIIKHKEQILATSALLVDDIIIHGRGIKILYEMLDGEYKRENIEIFVYKMNEGADALNDELRKRMKTMPYACDWEWRKISSQFVNLIYGTTSPYISFVGGYIEKGVHESLENFETAFEVINNANDYQKSQFEQSLVLFERVSLPDIFNKLTYDTCLRVYTNTNIEKTTYIPYVFLANVSTEDAKRIIAWLCERIPEEKSVGIRNDLLIEYSDQEGIAYQMRLVNALLNHIYFLYLSQQYKGMLNNATLDFYTISICYGSEIATEMSSLTYEDIKRVVLESFAEDVKHADFDEESELIDLLKGVQLNVSDIGNKMQFYFYENGMIDEQRASKGEPRKRGLTIHSFYQQVMPTEKHTISAYQLNSWDSGIASGVLSVKDGVLATWAAAGEQSFRFVLERFSNLIKELLYLYNSPLIENTKESGKEKVLHRLNEFIMTEEKENNYTPQELASLKEFVYKEAKQFGIWGIREILA